MERARLDELSGSEFLRWRLEVERSFFLDFDVLGVRGLLVVSQKFGFRLSLSEAEGVGVAGSGGLAANRRSRRSFAS